MTEEFPYMNVAQVAETLGITPGSVRRAISDGKLTAIRTGGKGQRAGFLLIEREEVERYRSEHLGRRGVAAASHPLHGLGRRKKPGDAKAGDPTPARADRDARDAE